MNSVQRSAMKTMPLAIAIALTGCSQVGMAPATGAPPAPALAHRSSTSPQDLYIGNILGGVLVYSTGKNPQEVGDITDDLPRVTGVWVDPSGILYAFTDNRSQPYETIEEFQAGASSPFFSLVVKRYGSLVAADAQHNVYAQGENSSQKQVIDVYAPGSQNYSNEYVVPAIGTVSEPQSMAFDSTGALLVGVAALADNKQGQIGGVFRLNGSSGTFENLNLRKAHGGLIATDAAGNLYVSGGTVISVYAPGATTPSRTVRTKGGIVALTAASNGTLYVGTNDGGIDVYAPGKSHPKLAITPQAQVSGLALRPG